MLYACALEGEMVILSVPRAQPQQHTTESRDLGNAIGTYLTAWGWPQASQRAPEARIFLGTARARDMPQHGIKMAPRMAPRAAAAACTAHTETPVHTFCDLL